MDKAILTLIKAGLEAAGMLFEYLGEDAKRQVKEYDAAANDAELRDQRLRELIAESGTRLEESVRAGSAAVIDKIESDKLEELIARTKNLGMIARLGKSDAALQYAFTLNESVEYAARRVKEQKHVWIGPWLSGQATFVAALELTGTSSDLSRRELEESVRRVRIEILNMLAPALLSVGRPPWELIAEFTRGENNTLLRELAAPAPRAVARNMVGSSGSAVVLGPEQAYCLNCAEVYPTKYGPKCSKCYRMNQANLSLEYPVACMKCKFSIVRPDTQECSRCRSPWKIAVEQR
jgi:hypothetical protein